MKMFIIYVIFALISPAVICETQRLEDGSLLEDFIVVNKGHMGYPTILMYIEQLAISECTDTCRRHLSCVTFNYNWNTRACELVDQKFDELEADFDEPDWYNYGIPEKIDGGWSNWFEGTTCSVTCGNGTQTQYRSCTSPEPKYGGAHCIGNEVRTVTCNEKPCPIDGGLSDWLNDGQCSVTCGGGVLNQIKTCTNPAPQHGGKDCTGNTQQTIDCNRQACPNCVQKTISGTCCKNSCYWSTWYEKYVCQDGLYTRTCIPNTEISTDS